MFPEFLKIDESETVSEVFELLFAEFEYDNGIVYSLKIFKGVVDKKQPVSATRALL